MGQEVIQFDDNQIAELQQYYLALKSVKDKALEATKELTLLKAEHDAASLRFWRMIEKMFSEAREGNWEFDENEWAIKRKPTSNGGGSPLDILRGLLGGI